jgi:hypothetical protein
VALLLEGAAPECASISFGAFPSRSLILALLRSSVAMMIMAMMTVVGPMPAVPVAWGSGIICIWIPGIWIVVNVRMPIISIWIII